MAVYFMGGEQIDFTGFFNDTEMMTTNSAYWRSDFARCSIRCPGGTDLRNNAKAAFGSAATSFWFSARVYTDVSSSLAPEFRTFLTFMDGVNNRLGFQVDNQRRIRLVKFEDGVTVSVLATSPGVAIQNTNLHKLDINIVYGVSGSVRVFFDQTQAFQYTGNITAGGSSSLNGFTISSINNGSTYATYWSEMIAMSRDTRTLMLKTHTPNATHSGNQWMGTHADIDEVTPNDADVVRTAEPGALAVFEVSNLPTNNLVVRGVKVAARVSRGEGGQGEVRRGVLSPVNTGQGALSAGKPVTEGWTSVSETWEVNPATNVVWTEFDINNMAIAFKAGGGEAEVIQPSEVPQPQGDHWYGTVIINPSIPGNGFAWGNQTWEWRGEAEQPAETPTPEGLCTTSSPHGENSGYPLCYIGVKYPEE